MLVPGIVRLRESGGYELVAGHRRKRACELAGLEKMPVIIKDLTDDEATVIMVDSNIQREELLISEKAFAYKMKYEALKRQGKRSDLTSCQVGKKLAAEEVSQNTGDSSRQILRYIHLTELIAKLLELADEKTFNFVIAMLQSQLFNLLCDKADDVYGGRLPVHVRVIADEFANIGQIPQFDKLIATIRSREISASIILQSQSQLKAMYKDSADTILGNCDTTLFLGGKEKTTLKEMSELLGKETIDLYNTSETRSNQKSFGLNYQKTGKQLMTEDEIAVMDGGKCILQIRGARPFFSDKYDITKHKNYRLLADENEKNRYKVEKELNPQYTPKSEEEVEVIHVELSE